MKETEKQLKALANRRRLMILKYLHRTAKASVGEIAKAIKLSLKSTSKHLGILRTADILEREQVNLQMYYSLVRPASPVTAAVLNVL